MPYPGKAKKYMGECPWATDPECAKAHLWCFKNNIFITPVETGYRNRMWNLEIQLGKKTFKSPEAYGPTDVWEKMYEFYKYYYNKYEKKI
tara:strand:+ start:3069 stop:3338 length:270 start_codon:yes stop_codon:yes gene_type:complete